MCCASREPPEEVQRQRDWRSRIGDRTKDNHSRLLPQLFLSSNWSLGCATSEYPSHLSWFSGSTSCPRQSSMVLFRGNNWKLREIRTRGSCFAHGSGCPCSPSMLTAKNSCAFGLCVGCGAGGWLLIFHTDLISYALHTACVLWPLIGMEITETYHGKERKPIKVHAQAYQSFVWLLVIEDCS